MKEFKKRNFRDSLIKRRKFSAIRRYFTKPQVLSVPSQYFNKLLPSGLEALEYQPVCVHERIALGEWTADPAEADEIASRHRRERRHATTVRIRN